MVVKVSPPHRKQFFSIPTDVQSQPSNPFFPSMAPSPKSGPAQTASKPMPNGNNSSVTKLGAITPAVQRP